MNPEKRNHKTAQIEHWILENSSTAILFLNLRLQIEYMNPAAEILFENSFQYLEGRPVKQIFQDPEQLAQCKLENALRSQQSFSDRAMTLSIAPNRCIKVDCTVTPMHYNGALRGLILELLQLDRQLRINWEENLLIQQSATRKLLRGLAHEIKNPLGGLRGAAQLLNQELDSAELREYTRVIIDEADRLQNLVSRMLGPNRLPQMRPTNIHEITERIYALIRSQSSAQLVIRRDYDPSIPEINLDQDQIIQALLNVASNAVRAAGPEGEVKLRTRVLRNFTLGVQRHKLVICIDIVDNGPGIPDDLKDKVFFPMISGAEGGTGLGLSIAQTLINQHRGIIEFESAAGHTQFSVYLPLE